MSDRLSFTALQTLYQSGRATIYRAKKEDDQLPVLLKVLSSRRSQEDVEMLGHEYELTRKLTTRAVFRPLALTAYQGLPALAFEDFEGVPLNSLLGSPMELLEFLSLGERIASALSEVHQENIIHKDLKPENIWVHRDTKEVKITGFGMATLLPREQQSVQKPRIIEGSFPYLSPEQTGRMNRSIDRRSDFYSLGIVFFEMLTARRLCNAQDALEWVHCHVARPAPSPRTWVPEIPEMIATLVLKLLSKMAEDRYQTARGLSEDLRRCRERLLSAGRIEPFELASQDIPDRLLIPQILYGREVELAVLQQAFQRVVRAGRSELALVSGYSGVGKSALVHELLRSIAGVRGFFLAGKFDQYKRNIPYATLAQAFRLIASELLGESEQELAFWREKLAAALGPHARLITDLVPEFELILGSQPEVPTLGLLEDEHRFHWVFTRFVEVFARAEHPLVLFLDDLQWTDPASLRLLEYLLTELGSTPLFIIAAYRDNEVGPSHPLIATNQRVRAAGHLVDHVILPPLSISHLKRLVADTVRRPLDQVQALAELLFGKTAGNPFFTIQFLTELSHEGLLSFDHAAHQWQWDLERIRKKGYTDNVVDLMVVRIGHLPMETRDILKLAASIGSATEARWLAAISERSEEFIHQSLFKALQEGFFARAGNIYRFAHDRIQQAAYSLIPEADRPGCHLRIGRLMLAGTSEAELPEHIFEIVNQLNSGIALLAPEERQRLTELNLIAGRKAKASVAYLSAVNYLSMGMSLLPPDIWETSLDSHYSLAFDLYLERAQSEFLVGNSGLTEDLLLELRKHARTKPHIVEVACAKIMLCVVAGDSPKAVEIGLACLRHFGIDWPIYPNWSEVQEEYNRLESNIRGRSIESLIDLPMMIDPDAAAIMKVLIDLHVPVMFTSGNLLCLLSCRMANTTVLFGNAESSSYGYVTLGMALVHFFGRYLEAYRFAKLGYDLVDRHAWIAYQARVYLLFALISSWSRPLESVREFLRKAIDSALQAGDISYLCFAHNNFATFLIVRGAPLAEIVHVCEECLAVTRKAKFRLVELVITGQLRLVMNLQGRTDHFSTFNGQDFDEAQYESELKANSRSLNIAICYYYIRKLMARFFSGDYIEALKSARQVQELLWTSPAYMEVPEYHYFHALTRAALFERASPEEREDHLRALHEESEHFRVWSENCPENFLHRHALVAAELARVEKRHLDAERLYEQGINWAREQDFVQHEALGLELAGRYYLERGFTRISETYFRDACGCYARWGALGKVKQLDRLYPQAIASPEAVLMSPLGRLEQLDFLSLIKASQSISGEVELKDLISRLIQVVIEQSGAQKGFLLLAHGSGLRIEAEARASERGIETIFLSDSPSIFSAKSPAALSIVPESIIQYVWRTREMVILMDASDSSKRGSFLLDEYLARVAPKSVLCFPIVRRTRLVGMLYLENNFVTNAFTAERITVLEVLAAQAAISLEVAFLLQQEQQARKNLKRSESRFRRISESNMIGIVFCDISGEIIEANDYFLRTVGYTRAELVAGRVRWTDLTPVEYSQRDQKAIEEIKTSGACRPYEKEYIRKDGRRIPILLGGAFLEGSKNELVAYIMDITERKQSEKERNLLLIQERQAHSEAETALRFRDEFMLIAGHELRTPITPLKLQLQALSRLIARETGADASKERTGLVKLFERSNQQVESLSRLIDDLLDISRISTGRLTLNLEWADLSEIVHAVVERYRLQWMQAGCRVEVQAKGGVSGQWDRFRIEQVVTNLLMNAIKYGAGKPVQVTVYGEGNNAELTIRDYGIGIDEKNQRRVFDRFERAVSFNHFGGLGVGLYISRQIVQAHGGNIRIHSRLGEGATFTVELPLSQKQESVGEIAA